MPLGLGVSACSYWQKSSKNKQYYTHINFCHKPIEIFLWVLFFFNLKKPKHGSIVIVNIKLVKMGL